jgi:hypothetical protein
LKQPASIRRAETFRNRDPDVNECRKHRCIIGPAGSTRCSVAELVICVNTVDMVAHGGTSVAGSFIQTLTMVDIATGRTECLPLLTRMARWWSRR